MDRRDFIRLAGTVSISSVLSAKVMAEIEHEAGAGSMPVPRRPLGRTGEELSVIGLGGIVVMGGTQQDADRRVAEAMDRGINYADVAPSYGQGEAERKLGPALKPYRDKVFLACKTQMRDKKGTAAELRASLKQMQTDHFDLYQMHAITDVEKDVERALAPDGAMAAFLEAKEQGLVRFLGFSAHSVAAALKAIDTGLFDTILYPVNFVCHLRGHFDQEVLARAKAKGMGVLALKAMARTGWDNRPDPQAERPYPKCWYEPVSDPAEAALALRWTLAQGVTAALPPGDERLLTVALNVATKDRPLQPDESRALEELAAKLTPIFTRPA